jgi:hypothetical protein
LIGLLGACGGQDEAPEAAPAPALLAGHFRASSDTARQVTGDVSVERAGLVFEKGVVLYTRTLDPRRGGDLMARDGDTYAAAVLGPAELAVELRRVTEQTVSEGAQGVCGDARPAYVALAYDERATSVTLLVFAGDEPPGPNATQSELCATFAYAAPDGARTRQGVLLR